MITITTATKQDIPNILALVDDVYTALPNKTWFSRDTDENLATYIIKEGFALKAECDNTLVGIFIVRNKNLGDENLGHELNLDEAELSHVAHMEVAMVRKEWRGHSLQQQMMEQAEDILRGQNYYHLLGTAHPDNAPSVNTFLKLHYEKISEKIKYGGLPRCIFYKNLNNHLND